MNAINKENFDGIKNIAGVVILYNPQKDVIQNIESYINQINFLYVIDNSEKRTSFVSDFYQKNPNVEYIFNNCNIGVAAALNMAANKAINHGYKFLLTMDQDSKATENMVIILYDGFKIIKNAGIISPFHDNKFHTKLPAEEDFSQMIDVMTSGNLLNLNAYRNTGNFNNDFFIDYVDIEYCLRLHIKEYEVICANKVVLQHNEANVSRKKLFFNTVHPSNHSYIRFYYKTRNRLYLIKNYKKKFPAFFRIERKMFWSTFIKAMLFEKRKLLKLKMVLLGYRDYLKRRTGSLVI